MRETFFLEGNYFSKTPWGASLGVWGSVWGAGVAILALKAYRFADKASFPVVRMEGPADIGQPGPGKGQVWPGQAREKLSPKSIWGAGCGRYCHRVVELLERKASFESKNHVLGAKIDQPRRCQGYTHPSRDVQGTPTQVGTFPPASRSGSYGSGPGWHKCLSILPRGSHLLLEHD